MISDILPTFSSLATNRLVRIVAVLLCAQSETAMQDGHVIATETTIAANKTYPFLHSSTSMTPT